jgi:26S proteasome regulatory subunit T1
MIGALLPSTLKWRVAAMPGQRGALRCYSAYRQRSNPVSDADAQLLADYATYRPRPLTLSTLLSFGRPLTTESVLRSFSYAVSELPKRLATRIRSLEGLPYIVGTNPYVAKTLGAYRDSFHWLVSYPEVRTLEENAVFAAQLEGLVQKHGNDIPIMAKG